VDTIDWLLDSDPAIRWQTLRDLTDAAPEEVALERARVACEGLGAATLARQEADGTWLRPDVPAWLSTLFTLLLLRAAGVDPADPAVKAALSTPEQKLRWNTLGGCWNVRPAETGGHGFFEGEEEPCINGGVLAFRSYFGRPSEKLARLLMSEQLEDGGWNCDAPKSTRSSFHTTICVLEGLLEYERASGSTPELTAVLRRGEEYLLDRHLFRRRSTGEVASADFLQLAFTPGYRYDVLRALDYFRAAGAAPDARLGEALDLLRSRRQGDGRWPLDGAHYLEALPLGPGETVGEPSRWNTLRALRVLRWAS